ncbi:hypothetical protein K402DRAFT_382925 [Aulographum hederae CBS 113979]|uniref:HPP transmembrane region domain-containing protein n=1 Tax=Aulographum hederae CBS 113979 TaxID=1176131 RepID=A0A6G1GRR2_9PEZI|nr:hypothetical protein K402DRAFT_382925 [Aulographum hederae CBS 113979]
MSTSSIRSHSPTSSSPKQTFSQHLHKLKYHNFNIDAFFSPYLPPSQLHRLPRPLARFLGHNADGPGAVREVGNLLVAWWAFFGAFCGIAAVGALLRFGFDGWDLGEGGERGYEGRGVGIVGSLGATAILNYNTIASPLSQPRNSLLGQAISALTGVATTKLFHHTHPSLFTPSTDLSFLPGALATALASSLMLLTNTVHPPGGATALLAATNRECRELGWVFVPVVTVGSVVLMGVGLGVNNVQRQYPRFWWVEGTVGEKRKRKRRKEEGDVEAGGMGKDVVEGEDESASREKKGEDAASYREAIDAIVVRADGLVLPEGLVLNSQEEAVVELLRGKLKERKVSIPGMSVSSIAASERIATEEE